MFGFLLAVNWQGTRPCETISTWICLILDFPSLQNHEAKQSLFSIKLSRFGCFVIALENGPRQEVIAFNNSCVITREILWLMVLQKQQIHIIIQVHRTLPPREWNTILTLRCIIISVMEEYVRKKQKWHFMIYQQSSIMGLSTSIIYTPPTQTYSTYISSPLLFSKLVFAETFGFGEL